MKSFPGDVRSDYRLRPHIVGALQSFDDRTIILRSMLWETIILPYPK